MSSLSSKILRSTIQIINGLFPKQKRKVFFASIPDFDDNARALYNYMLEHDDFKDWYFVWLVDKDFKSPAAPNTIFLHYETRFSINYLRYLYHVFTAKYLFCTHSHFAEANPRFQVSVCLWHGTMLKRICAMNEREKDQPRKDQYRYFITPSRFYEDIFQKCFLCKDKQMLTCGYPRNDFLFKNTNILDQLGIDKKRYDKIIVYMPTFRQTVGDAETDSKSKIGSCIDFTNKTTLSRISSILSEQRVLLIIKWHPADIRCDLIINEANICSILPKTLTEIDKSVYHLLHHADALITDFSSVYCDYILLDRPIAFDIADIESYNENRGFVFDDPVKYMPGSILRNENDWINFINNVAHGKDTSAEIRHSLFNVYNDYNDGKSSERIINNVITF